MVAQGLGAVWGHKPLLTLIDKFGNLTINLASSSTLFITAQILLGSTVLCQSQASTDFLIQYSYRILF